MKKSLAARWGAVVLCVGLTACGGGGGGSGNGNVLGSPAAAGAGAGASPSPGAIALQAPGEEEAPSLTSQAATGPGLDAQAIAARLNAADARNGVYYVYAAGGTNGIQPKLAVNFDAGSYSLTDSRGQATSGTFHEDPSEPGTYVFASGRITSAVNTARFRVTTDAVVGAFAFEKPLSNPIAYEVTPFVAARGFVTAPAQLDGTYNYLGIGRSSNGIADSQSLAMRISGSGAILETCSDNTVGRMESCPGASKRTYAIAASPDFAWTATSTLPGDPLRFRMARINGHNVWLSDGSIEEASDSHAIGIALKAVSDWSHSRHIGASTDGSWGAHVFGVWRSVRSAVTPAGVAEEVNLSLASIREGLRLVNSTGAKRYYAMHNGALSVVVGEPTSNTRGAMEINLFKERWDARNGRYTVFATNGTEQALEIDFDKQVYTMTAPDGNATSGTFGEDPRDPGTYVFSNERIACSFYRGRFCSMSGVIVGVFPFSIFKSDPVAYAVQPFIAARSFVTDRRELAGIYDAITATGGMNNLTQPGNYMQFHIDAEGTVASMCAPRATVCSPATSLASYAISPGMSPGIWLFTRDGRTSFSIRVARINTRKVMLQSSESFSPYVAPSSPLYPYPIWILLMGFQQPTGVTFPVYWPAMRMHVASIGGAFGTASLDATRFASAYSRSDGTLGSLEIEMLSVSGSFQVREGIDGTGAKYQMGQNGVIALVHAASPFGNLHIGLAD